jgi:FtsP/CotA-like multicopper oxidase with cupredoxin domain
MPFMIRKSLLFFGLLFLSFASRAQYNPLWIPDTLTGTTFNLTVRDTFRQFFPGQQTITEAVNGSWWGPTLIFNKGQNVQLNVINQLMDTTTMHWHGVHLPAYADGGPHQPIPPSATWSPAYKVLNNASTYWYHPHLHMMVEEQVNMGIGGFIIVRDSAEATLNLPRTYGVDDIPIVLTDRRFDANNQIVQSHFGDTMVVNGTINPEYTVPAQIVRLRILNAAAERFYRFGFSNNATFRVITTDGGLMNAPVSQTRFTLAPGERVEILVNFAGLSGTSLDLIAYNNTLPGDVAGSSAGTGVFANALGGRQFNLLHLNVGAMTANPVTAFPATLLNTTFPSAANATVTRHITMSDGGALCPAGFSGCGMLDSAFFNINVINQTIILNTTEIWEIQNVSAFAHPFHMHNIQFYILDRNGVAAPTYEKGWKDVMQVRANTTARFITRFTDYADSIRPYMYHCHNLFHEDGGMMGQFVVIDTMRLPIAVMTVSDSVICAGDCITFTASAQTNVDHYQWNFTGGTIAVDTTHQVTVCYNTPGNYNVTLIETNQSGADTIARSGFIKVNALPNISFSAADSVCINSGNVTLNGLPSGGNFSGPHVSGAAFDPSAAGTFTVSYTYTSAGGCTNTATHNITVNALPPVNFPAQNPVCENAAPVVLNATPSGGIYSGAGISGNSFLPSLTGNGSFEVYYDYMDASGCIASDSTDITVLDTPVVSITALGNYCDNDGPVTLNGNPAGGTFSGSGVAGNTFDPRTGAGSYPVIYIYTAPDGCISSDGTTATVSAAPAVMLTGPDSMCVNEGAVTLQGLPSGGAFSGATVTSSFDPAAAGAGDHYIYYHYTDGAGCSNADTALITVLSLPVITFTIPAAVCANQDSVALIALPSGGIFTGTGVNGNYFYPALADTGDFYIRYIFADSNGCVAEDSAVLHVDSVPFIQLHTVAPLCINAAPVTLTGEPAGGFFSGPGITGAILDPAAAGAGMHAASYIYITGAGCSDTSNFTVTINDLTFTDVIFDSVFCISDSAAAITVIPAGGILSGPGVVNAVFDPAVSGAGSFNINYIYTDSNSCTNSDSIIITVYNNPAVSFLLPDTACTGDEVLLSGNPAGGVFSGTGITDSIFYTLQSGPGMFTISYYYTDMNSCSGIFTDSIFVETPITISFTAPDTICEEDGAILLNATPAGGTFTGPGVSGNNFDPVVSGNGSFYITYSVTGAASCTAMDSVLIDVVTCGGIAEAASGWIRIYPNPASQNVIVASNTFIDQLSLFNSFGQIVYESIPTGKSTSINLEQLSPGMLILRISKDGKYYYRKITKR